MLTEQCKIYIAGRITGLDPEIYLSSFEAAEREVIQLGGIPVNPTKLVAPKLEYTWEDYMGESFKHLLRSDAIYLLENWSDSRGADLERTAMLRLKRPVIYQRALPYILQLRQLLDEIHQTTGILVDDYVSFISLLGGITDPECDYSSVSLSLYLESKKAFDPTIQTYEEAVDYLKKVACSKTVILIGQLIDIDVVASLDTTKAIEFARKLQLKEKTRQFDNFLIKLDNLFDEIRCKRY